MIPGEPKYAIGTQFKTRGKHPRLGTVIDIWKTYNQAGHLVDVNYVATFEFCGQTVTDRTICETTIAMGLRP